MPSLIATLGLDGRSFAAGLNQAEADARVKGKRIADQINAAFFPQKVRSTIENASMGPRERYVEQFKRLVEERERQELEAAVRAAARSNAARRLLRQRAAERERREAIAAQEALDAAIEQAARNNLARRLRRERAMKRAAQAEEERRNSLTGRITDFFGNIGRGAISTVAAGIAAVTSISTAISATRDFVSASIDVDLAYQRIFNTLKAGVGNFEAAKNEMEFLRAVAAKTGMTVTEIGQDYANLMMAAKALGLSVSDTRRIFESFSLLGASMGLPAERQKLILLALTQMMSKGNVTMEELKRQLAEHLPQAFDLFAQATGKSRSELVRMIESGDLSATVLSDVARVIEQMNPQVNNTTKSMGALRLAWEEVKAAFGEEIRPETEAISQDITRLMRVIKEFGVTKKMVDQITGRPLLTLITAQAKGDIETVLRIMDRIVPSWSQKIRSSMTDPSAPPLPDEPAPLPDFRIPREQLERQLKLAEEEKRLAQQIADEKVRGEMIGLSTAEKRLRLLQAIKDAESEIYDATTGRETMEAELRHLRAINALKAFDEATSRRAGGDRETSRINELQRVGAYSAQSVNVSLLREAQLQNQKLDQIIENTRRPMRISNQVNFS